MNVNVRDGVRSRGTIVIAEDDAATRMLLCQVLKRENFHVIAVDNGRLACDAVRREHPDVVLLDWLMPVMDGPAALKELKSSKETRGIPIVMLTSQSQVDERIIALEAGVQDFLSKPFDPRELVACIEQQLRWRQGLAVDARAAFLEERNALLAASERRYRLLAEAMPHMVWMAEPRGRVTYVNRAWSEYTATAFDQIGSDGWATALHPDDRTSALRDWFHSLDSGEPFEIQCRFRRASDGMYRWHLGRAIPMSDANGAIVEWVGSCADIHDYKIASETRAILDTIGSIVAIRTEAGFVDYTSPYWSQYTGSQTDSGLGLGWRDFIHPEDLETVQRGLADVNGSAADAHQYEMRIRRHDGQYRWFLSRSNRLPRTDGEPLRWLDTSTDVDDLKRTQSALENSETRYRALTDSMPQLVWVIDATAQFEYVNHRWSEYTGLTLEQTRDQGDAAIVNADDLATMVRLHSRCEPDEFTCEARFRGSDGAFRWHLVRAVPFYDAVDSTQKWIGTATDIEESKLAAARLASTAAELEHLALHDVMTDLPNRMLLVERLAQAIALAQRGKTGVIVLYLDLDRFKVINDTLGHAAGDRVLSITGKRISDALRAGDTASRVGGDEFVLVCATSEGAEDAARVAARLHAAVGQPIDVQGETVSVGASIGISLYPTDGVGGDELIEKADQAMYAAKQSGRNAFRMYSADTHRSIVAALDFETELRKALDSRQIVVHFQPIVSLPANRPIGAQALVCWEHPRRGLLMADEFLPFAEDHRFTHAIGALVLDAVCRQIDALRPTVGTEFTIAMNVSARQFAAPDFIAEIAAALATYAIDPRHLEIEIAEHVMMSDTTQTMQRLTAMQALGVRIAIGDFGTGYRSLAALESFPLHAVKIDRSLIADMLLNAADQHMANAVITLGHNLGLRVIADGAETAAQINALRRFGPDVFQAYIASKPLAADDFEHFLHEYERNDSRPPAPSLTPPVPTA